MSALTAGFITAAERYAAEGDGYLRDALEGAKRGLPPGIKVTGNDDADMQGAMMHALLRWRANVYPCVSVSEKLAASFALTKLPRDLPPIKWPWDAFCVLLPPWVAAEVAVGYSGEAALMFVEFGELGFGTWLLGNRYNDVTGSRQGIMSQPVRYDSLAKLAESTEENGDEVGRVAVRIAVGALCELNSVPPTRPRTRSVIKHEKRGMPTAWNLQVTRDVKVDLREAAGRLVRGESHRAFLQRLVRGHWQHYWVGKRGQQRAEMRHKEPYWQGDENAPIALRAHVLGGVSK